MLITEKSSVISSTFLSCQHVKQSNNGGRKRRVGAIFMAKKKESNENQPIQLKISKKLLSQSVVGVLGLGFIDAGYSGDWSRIGVVSKEIEDLLKLAAFLVVPLCIFLIYSISKDED